jgi:Zn finger protein HypA/HybF involved in hydrogenase expression
MLFSTYEVSGDSEMVKKAIENNGYVDIKFYKEKKAPVVYYNNTGNYRGRCIYDNFNNFNTTVGTADTIGTFTSSSTPTFKSSNTPIDSLYNSNIEYLSEELDVKKPKQRMSKLKACKVETGRVEMGDYSNQNFKQISVEFETLPFYIVEYKLLPISSKNYETTEIRNYCPKCSYRIRKQSWLYCPKCSEKL